MKKQHFILTALLCFIFSANFYGQTTNVFPDDGSAGIGTTSPALGSLLDVRGLIKTKSISINPPLANDSNFLKMGQTVGGGLRLFNFGSSTLDGGYVGYTSYDINSNLRLDFTAKDDQTYFGMRDENGLEIFKVSRDVTNGSYIHLPKIDSRIVIGDFGGYLLSEGHKLVIKDGSAKIEGNIISDGNIGIGTDSFDDGADTYRLSIEGKMRAHAIKVYTDWADFVFEENYELPTLSEVEVFIKENGHLENIPSAIEVEENGIDVGEMNKLLLQKVEELTLYVIELNKKIEELEK